MGIESSQRSFSKSARYHREAANAIAGGVNSNVRLQGTPLCFQQALGSRLFDIDGNSYIDYALGMGPAILGHAHPKVVGAIRDCLSLGQIYAGQSPAELEFARRVQRLIPSAELIRLGMTGSEMVQAALRVARAYTGRNKVVKFEGHYHGWFDNVLAGEGAPDQLAGRDEPFSARVVTHGQPESSIAELLVLPWNSIDTLTRCLQKYGSDVAAVLMEPMMCNTGAILPRPGYLEAVRRLCDDNGTVLIFDEVITGFRVAVAGAQGRFGVQPDLSTFAKAIGAGFPLAMLTGRRQIMDLIGTGQVNHSGTYNSNVVSITAGLAAIEVLSAENGAVLEHVERLGQSLMEGLVRLGRKHRRNLCVSGLGSAFNTAFTDHPSIYDAASFRRSHDVPLQSFLQGLLLRGVRPTSRGTWFVSGAHTEADIEATLAAADEVLGEP